MSHRDKEYISQDLMPGLVLPMAFFLAVFSGAFYGLLSLTWSIGVPAFGLLSLGELSSHSSFLIDGAVHFMGLASEKNQWPYYLNQARENGAVLSITIHLLLPGIVTLPASIWLSWLFSQALVPKLTHVSGIKYFYRPNQALASLRESIRRVDGSEKNGVPIHPEVPIDRERDNKGLLIMGGMGSGKTQFQLPRIKAIIEQGHRLFINDSKGEFTQSLEHDNFVLLAPWDSRSWEWDIAADVCDRSSARVLAELYIKDSHDPMWSLAARQVLVGMLMSLIESKPRRWGFEDLTNVMTLEAEDLARLIATYNPEALHTIRNLESETGKTAEGIMINLQSFMSPFYDMAKAWKGVGGFSIRRWLEEDYTGPKTVVVQGSERFKTIGRGLVSSLLTFVISDMADPSFPEAKHRKGDYRIYFNLDEFPTMGRVPLIERLISVCRSKGAYVTLAFQDIAQGIDLYGKELINTWITNLSNKIIGSVAVGPTAAFVSSEILGDREVKIPTSSVTYDSNGNPSRTINYPLSKIPVIKPNEFSLDLGFPPNKTFGYGLYLGERLDGVYRLKWNKTYTKEVRPPVIFADWVKGGKEEEPNPYSDAFPLQSQEENLDGRLNYNDRRNLAASVKAQIEDEGIEFNARMEHLSELFKRGRLTEEEYASKIGEAKPNKSIEAKLQRIKDLSDDEKLSLIRCLENQELVSGSFPIPDKRYLSVITNDLQAISYKLQDPERATDAHNLFCAYSKLEVDNLKEPLQRQNISFYMQRRKELRLKESA